MVVINGKSYIRIGDKLIAVDHFDAGGKPVIKTRSEETTNPDGSKNCTIHVNVLQIAGKKE